MQKSPSRALLLLLAAASACASAPKVRKEVVWPSPPDKARIKFVTAIAHEGDLEAGGWTGFKRGLFGGGPSVRVLHPMGLALTRDGQKLFVADLRGSQVLSIDLAAKRMSRFADDEMWQHPSGIAVDASGNVYVSDAKAQRVHGFDAKGTRLWSIGSEIERPTGMVVDDERKILYVTDSGRQESDNHRVFAVNFQGKIMREVGRGRGDGDGQFNFPSYLALDAKGNLFVSDTLNFRIQVFDPEGNFVRTVGQQGTTPGTLGRIKGLAFDAYGDLYVADAEHSVVQIFNPRFEPLMYFGGRAQLLEFFDLPSAIAIDRKRNRIYVANEMTARINVYDLINTTEEDVLAPLEGGQGLK